MAEIDTELSARLITAHKSDGRCIYDRQAKRQLVQECMKPGVSVSRMAMLYGVNANLLRKWIDKSARQDSLVAGLRLPDGLSSAAAAATPAFVQLQVATQKVLPEMTADSLRMQARLPNGVGLEFGEATPQALSAILRLLSTLPCSS